MDVPGALIKCSAEVRCSGPMVHIWDYLDFAAGFYDIKS